jgi:hypothetical protein
MLVTADPSDAKKIFAQYRIENLPREVGFFSPWSMETKRNRLATMTLSPP